LEFRVGHLSLVLWRRLRGIHLGEVMARVDQSGINKTLPAIVEVVALLTVVPGFVFRYIAVATVATVPVWGLGRLRGNVEILALVVAVFMRTSRPVCSVISRCHCGHSSLEFSKRRRWKMLFVVEIFGF
jgi:hypothetical protein